MTDKPILVLGGTGKTGSRVTARGFPAEAAQTVNELAAHIRDGHSDYLSDGVQRALGREPRELAASLRTAVAEGRFKH